MDILKRFSGLVRWQRIPVGEIEIKRPEKEAAIALGYTAFYVLAAWFTGTIIGMRPLPLLGSVSFITDFSYSIVFKIGLLLLIPVAWYIRQGYHLRDLFPGARPGLRAIVIAYAAGLSLNLLQGWLRSFVEIAAHFTTSDLVVRCVIGVVLPLFIAAIPEEFVYRGFLQTRLERVSGRLPAIVITAVLFAAWHIPTRFLLASGVEGTAGNLVSVLLGTGVPVFVIGLLFGLVWDRYRNLLLLIAVHWGVDTVPTLASFLGIHF